jgi:phospholipid/cholesterol/gamma-HCH transport system ATP-binding protein
MVELPRLKAIPHSDGSRSSSPYFEFDHVFLSFGERPVLKDVSLRVMPGETVCLMGRSGVGKSVSLRMFMGFIKPGAGRVISAHEDITDYDEQQLARVRKRYTMVFQEGALFDSLTLGDNVAFPLRERGGFTEDQISRVVDRLLDIVGVKDLRDLLPSEISTGMKRSVAIARAIAANPEAILYDEPTSMVDPLTVRSLGNLIKQLKLRLGLTSIVVTHDTKLAQEIADRSIFLEAGKIVFSGTMVEAERSHIPLVREFLEFDRLDWRELLPEQNLISGWQVDIRI